MTDIQWSSLHVRKTNVTWIYSYSASRRQSENIYYLIYKKAWRFQRTKCYHISGQIHTNIRSKKCNSDSQSERERGLSFNADILLRNREIEKYLLKFTFKMYILLLDIHNENINFYNLWNTKELTSSNVHHLQMHKGQIYIIFMFLFVFRKNKRSFDSMVADAKRKWHTTGLQQAQQEFTRPASRLLGVLRYWALVLVTAPCFCRRWSLSWLLCLKWRSHFSQW